MYSMLRSDPEKIKGAKIGRPLVARVLREFARPYRSMLIAFIAIIVGAAVADLGPPLLFRQIIDSAIPEGDAAQLTRLSLVVVALALTSAALSFGERLFSSRVGEGLIFDLRVRLFDHVQQMPIAFFTRTQTGALISRLNNDVLGAQRALTSTLGSVVSNVIVLTTTLVAMFILDWRLTLVALVLLPLFIIPAKRVGKRMQALTREGMNYDADMSSRMTERFNVSGALLVKLFGDRRRETEEFSFRANRVRDLGVRSALYGRTFFIALGLVGAIGTATVYWLGGLSVINGVITVGTLVAMAAFVTRIYQPLTALTNARVDIMTAFVSFDRVFEVLDEPNPITEPEGAITLTDPAGHIRFDDVWFRVPDHDRPVPRRRSSSPAASPTNATRPPTRRATPRRRPGRPHRSRSARRTAPATEPPPAAGAGTDERRDAPATRRPTSSKACRSTCARASSWPSSGPPARGRRPSPP